MENMVNDDRLLFFGSLFISLSATQFLTLFCLALGCANMNSESSASDNAESIYPCGKCQTHVTYDHK